MLISGSAVAHADRIVVEIVRRRDLQAAGAEGGIDVVVGDDRDLASGQWQQHACADQVAIALILRMHRDARHPPAWFPGAWSRTTTLAAAVC